MSRTDGAATARFEREQATIVRLAKLSELTLRRDRASGSAATRCCPTAPPSSSRWATRSTSAASAAGWAPRSSGSARWSSRRRRSSATSSSSPARRRTWSQREREKLATWREQRDVLAKKRELLGCVSGARARRDAAVRRVACCVLSAVLAARLRPHRAAAGRPARRRAAAAHRDPARLVRAPPRVQGRRRVPVRRGDLRRRLAQPGHRHRRSREAGHPLAHRRGARGQLAAEPDHRPARRGLEAQPGVPGGAAARASPISGATGATAARCSPSPPARPVPTTTLEGTSWTGPPAGPRRRALVDALLLPDSLPYRGLADSSGRFALGPLPPGDYLVSGVLDENREPPGRSARGIRQRAGRRAGKTARWRALDLRARHHPAPHPHGHRRRQRVGHRRVHPEARPAPAPRSPPRCGSRCCPTRRRCRSSSMLPKPLDDSLHATRRPARGLPRRRHHRRRHHARGRHRARAGRRGRAAAPARRWKPLTTRPPLTDRLVLRVPQPWKPGRALDSRSGASGT